MKKIALQIIFFLVFGCAGFSQLLAWSPNFPIENDTATNVVITVDAAKGNQGLLNYTPATDVYVHTGVITNLSASQTDWRYVKFNQNFNQSNPALQAAYIGNNKWQFTISGGLRNYYGISNASEHILKIAILFRNGNGTAVQRNANGNDMYVPVYDSSLVAVRFTNPLFQPLYNRVPEPISKKVGDSILLTAISNKPATLNLYLNGNIIQTAGGATSISMNAPLTSSGNQVVVAEANDGVTDSRDTFNFFVNPGITIVPLPAGVRDGINYEPGDTSVTLVLYAPFKNRVSVIGEFPGSNWAEQPKYVMNETADSSRWWIRVTGLSPGVEYAFQYLVDGSLKIAEPYTEKILDPNNDQYIPATTYPNLRAYPRGFTTGIVSLLQTRAPVYNWQVTNFRRPDKRNLIIYELLVRDFVAAHDWNTISDSLNYLKSLGINAIEVMPFNEFEGNSSWGYNPDFYFAPDKYYGPKNTLKQFIDSCHSRGIAVIMDIALNHSFGSSPLVQLYFNTALNRPAANNPWFNPVARHAFNVGYDMNHQSPATHYFVSRVMENWLVNYKLDGFRFDLAKGFTQTQTCDSNGNNCNVAAWTAYDSSRVAIWKGYYDTLQLKSPGSYPILEHFADNSEETVLSNYGFMLWGNENYNFNQASMGYNTDWNFEWGLSTVRGWANPYLVTYMESHDEERLMYKNITYGNSSGSYNIKDTATALKRIETCAAFFLNMPGPKMIWQFGELGYDYSITSCNPGNTIPQPYPNGQCRLDPKPIRWDYAQDQRRKHLHDMMAKLIQLRFHPYFTNNYTSNRVDRDLSGAIKWLKLTTDTSNILVVGNFDVVQQTGTITFQNAGTWYDYLNGGTIAATGAAQNITLQAGEYHVYINRKLAPDTTTPPPVITKFAAKVYPNPAGASSVIELQLPQDGNVQVALWNFVGQKVADIYNGPLPKGVQHLLLNGVQRFSGGIYLLKVQTATASETIKIVLP
jgi:1,4-alpha-glucan branching enzyme